MRTCSKCGIPQKLSEFYSDGKWCKSCIETLKKKDGYVDIQNEHERRMKVLMQK